MTLFYIITAFFLFSLFFYFLLISKFISGWSKTAYFTPKNVYSETAVSVIIACKNEISHLPELLTALKKQSYENFELILVDDHSSDGSFEYSFEIQREFPLWKVVKNSGKGKKSAIKTGVYLSSNDLLVTLDADSTPEPDWLKAIVQFYEQEPAELIIGPVLMSTEGSFFQNFQQFEFTSLVGSGAGAAGAGMPIFCNGANLIFRKEAWLKSEPELYVEIPSGDDLFLLQSIKKRGETIRFLKSTDAIAVTKPAADLKAFFRQRKRWASKKPVYKDVHLKQTGVVVFMASFSVLASLILSVFNHHFFCLFLVLFGLKWVTDIVFFEKIKTFYNLQNVLKNSIFFSLIYPFYIVFTTVYALGGKQKQTW